MIVTLSRSGVSAEGVYPGGQSENPASPWYDNLIPLWWNGQYLPVPTPATWPAREMDPNHRSRP